MSQPPPSQLGTYDVIVVGAGLAGLCAALRLQRDGRRVLIIEQRARAGGLCGTMNLDGYEFVLACNDFGRRTAKELAKLGVPVSFRALGSRFVSERGHIQSPPDLHTILALLRQAPDILRLVRLLRRTSGDACVGELLERHRIATPLRDLLGIAAYAMGAPLSGVPVSALAALFSKEWSYGYDQAMTPVGGPAAMVARMVERFEQSGGTLRLNTRCQRIEGAAPARQVVTPDGTFTAGCVISSEGRWSEYPAHSQPSLAVSMLLLAVRRSLPFPAGFHTLGYLPRDFCSWMEPLSRGEQPPRFGFHLFRCDLPEQPEHRTLNIYFFLPRGWSSPDAAQRQWAERFILEHAEALLPGLNRAIVYKRLLGPQDFTEQTGQSSLVVPRLPPAGFQKPAIYDPGRDLYFIGNSVYPPGEHAAGAILSGIFAAEAVLRRKDAAQRP